MRRSASREHRDVEALLSFYLATCRERHRQVHYVDAGYNLIAMPNIETLKSQEDRATRHAAE
jgi:hypothetical protein